MVFRMKVVSYPLAQGGEFEAAVTNQISDCRKAFLHCTAAHSPFWVVRTFVFFSTYHTGREYPGIEKRASFGEPLRAK